MSDLTASQTAHDKTARDGSETRNPRRVYANSGKRLFDMVLAAAALPFLIPVILVLALLVSRDGAWPFFGHKRVGRDGKAFRCWKVRTMVPNAEQILHEYLEQKPDARAEWSANFKLTDDPRITRTGNFLRRSSLDELPQIWNILKGEMSFVGPRPVTATELELYGPHRRDYEMMRPGLTGLWQVSGRNDVSYAERVRMDVEYTGQCSLVGDVVIIMRTVGAVLMKSGR